MRTMNRFVFSLVVVVGLAGCENKDSSPPSNNEESSSGETEPTASVSSSAVAPVKTPEKAPDPAPAFDPSGAAACDEAKLQATVDGMAEAMASYFTIITPVVNSKESCAVVTKKLKGLESYANKFVETITGAMSSVKALGPSCQERAKEMGAAMTKKMQEAFPDAEKIDMQMRLLVERCRKHPGFEEAASKGLKMMRRK